jgi:hypothetical protein
VTIECIHDKTIIKKHIYVHMNVHMYMYVEGNIVIFLSALSAYKYEDQKYL